MAGVGRRFGRQPGGAARVEVHLEHPELIAERLGHFIDLVGPDRVMAGTDCGFGTWAGFGPIDPTICWAKFEAMAQGARLAAQRAYA